MVQSLHFQPLHVHVRSGIETRQILKMQSMQLLQSLDA